MTTNEKPFSLNQCQPEISRFSPAEKAEFLRVPPLAI